MVVADAHGCLEHRQGEGLHAEAQQTHVLPLGGKELEGCRLAVYPRGKLVVESLHDCLEVSLAVPKRVIGVEGYYLYLFCVHLFHSSSYSENVAGRLDNSTSFCLSLSVLYLRYHDGGRSVHSVLSDAVAS